MRVQLGDVVNKIVGDEDRQVTKRQFYVGGEHLDSSRIRVYRKGLLDADARRTLGYQFHYPFEKGDVLFMTKNPYLKKCAQVDFDGICSIATFVIRTKDASLLLQDFLPIILQTDLFWDYMESHKSGSVNYFITWKTLASYPFDLPSIERQKEIINLAWAVETSRVAYEKLLLHLDELVKARFVEMFGDPEINNKGIPQSSMVDLCEIIDGDRGKNYPKSDDFSSEGYCLFLNAKNVTHNGFSFYERMYISKERDEALSKGRLQRGDVILTTRGTIGNLAYYTNDIPYEHVRINSGMVILRMKNGIVDETFFIEQFKMLLESIKSKIASGSAQPQLPISTMNKIMLLLPDIDQQKKFSTFVHQLDKSKVAVNKALDSTISIFSDLLKEWSE